MAALSIKAAIAGSLLANTGPAFPVCQPVNVNTVLDNYFG